MTNPQATRAFSLIEVVFALAIVVFAGFALVGLLGVGLLNTQDSRERLQAATIAEAICATRRAAPTNDLSAPQPYFPLPVLNPPGTGPISNTNNLATPTYLTRDGMTTNAANASFGFLYNVNATTNSPGVASVYLCFFWPAQASPTNPSTGHYEIATTFALP